MITREELIIRMMPFHDQLVDWCRQNPKFLEALKIIYPDRFIALQAIYTSTSPYAPEDEVIGFLVYDSKEEIFKQDFIINIKRSCKKFVLYTKLPQNMPKTYDAYIKPIGEFYKKYARGTYYKNTHHIKFEDLDDKLKPRALRAIRLAKGLKKTGLRQLSQQEIQKITEQLQKEQKRSIE